MSEQQPDEPALTLLQETALYALCEHYGVEYEASHYHPAFDLPKGWFEGWIGGPGIQQEHPTIFVGVSPEGEAPRACYELNIDGTMRCSKRQANAIKCRPARTAGRRS